MNTIEIIHIDVGFITSFEKTKHDNDTTDGKQKKLLHIVSSLPPVFWVQ